MDKGRLGGEGVVPYVELTPKRHLGAKDARQKLLGCFFDCNSYCNGHTNHGVVTCADRAFHARGVSKKPSQIS